MPSPSHSSVSGSELWRKINSDYLADEATIMRRILEQEPLQPESRGRIFENARRLVHSLRQDPTSQQGLDAFLSEYDLSSEEGVVLMCLAEALLRIPDAATADTLIRDKLSRGQWDEHLGNSRSALVNASTWGLMLTGKFIRLAQSTRSDTPSYLKTLTSRAGEPVIRRAILEAMGIIGLQFVLGQTIEKALQRSNKAQNRRFLYSYDMLGEAALTQEDADRFFESYAHAIETAGKKSDPGRCGISIKLSALHPRYEYSQYERVLAELVPRLHDLTKLALRHDLLITIDAEEADRQDLMLDVFSRVFRDHAFRQWNNFGLVVQAYQKRALAVLDWLQDMAIQHKRTIPVRLVKGAYWDTEIKRAQVQGLTGYPVYTRKFHTDTAYIACVNRLFKAAPHLYPQFATHNAHSACSVLELAADKPFEFQRLHGMGQGLYEKVLADKPEVPCRVYAPVGGHAELLPYLVRRLLENGANTSFVNRISHNEVAVEELVADPISTTQTNDCRPHPRIPLPVDLYGSDRNNSIGINFSDNEQVRALQAEIQHTLTTKPRAAPRINGEWQPGTEHNVSSPANRKQIVGTALWATSDQIEAAVAAARAGFDQWRQQPVAERTQILLRAADELENSKAQLIALCTAEGGRDLRDADAEVREAIDFCRYYAAQARIHLGSDIVLPGPSGESNRMSLHGRGVFVCISPWNFPVAIFTGQVVAALAAGNCVIAKPAEQTAISAGMVVEILHRSGIPGPALQFLPGDGSIGAGLVEQPIDGVAFTGSTETAKKIEATLNKKHARILPFIAETGGQNAMIVDSSALPEQVITDVLYSTFNSVGQRCSALRVLYLQQDIADHVIAMLKGAMAELVIGDPADLSTDVGPVIDERAQSVLQRHVDFLQQNSKLIYRCRLPSATDNGTFFAPQAYEITSINLLKREVFGPILHVIRYDAAKLDRVIDDINSTGYGLTFGIHSRIEETVDYISSRIRAGNVYVNRNVIGAVVGVQPFGGEGLSGTGPKAGGPNYLKRFCNERTVSDNIAAVGGNADLLSLND